MAEKPKYKKRDLKRKIDELAEIAEHLRSEAGAELEAFINNDVIPNAPGLTSFMRESGSIEHPHEKLGFNPHPLTCGRCGRKTPLVIPLGKFNAIWSCNSCKAQMYSIEDDFVKCPSCSNLMTQEKIFRKDEPVCFDYECKVCREHQEAQTKIATNGGAIVVCPVCSTSGTLPEKDKQVIRFRKEHGLSPQDEVRFLLIETQCPRCADREVARVFTPEEQNRILLLPEDVDAGFSKKKEDELKQPAKASKKVGKKKEDSKDVAPKKNSKPANVVGSNEPAEDEVRIPGQGFYVHHPGSKTHH